MIQTIKKLEQRVIELEA